MESQVKPVQVMIELSIPSRAARDALESKIETFISNQNEGSSFRSQYRENSKNLLYPFWFHTVLEVFIDSSEDLPALEADILSKVDLFGTVIDFNLDYNLSKASEE